jgi:hypothetical protein
MDWIVNAANEANAERHKRETIRRGAPVLWANLCRAIEQAVRTYKQLQVSDPVEFSGCANHVISVVMFQPAPPPAKGPEREKITITFNEERSEVVVARSSNQNEIRTFPLNVNAHGHVCLTFGNREISVEEFTEIALRDAFFPPRS